MNHKQRRCTENMHRHQITCIS